jgi:hypothetical protein
MKILIAAGDAATLQLLQNARIDLCNETILRPTLFSNDQKLQQQLTTSHRSKRRDFKS